MHMTPEQLTDFQALKKQIREQAHANRAAQADKDAVSQAICEKFAALAYTHRKEHVRAIEEAKAPETRQRRIAKALDILRGGGR